MFSDELRFFSGSLRQLGDFGNCAFHWHFVDSGNLRDVPADQMSQNCAICRELKKFSGRMLARCIATHHDECFVKARLERRPFLICCHAGLLELAVPFFAGDKLFAVLFAGVFAAPGGAGYPMMAGQYAKLPRIAADRLLALGDYLASLWKHLVVAPPEDAPAAAALLPQLKTTDARLLHAAHFMRLHCGEKLSAARIAAEAGLSTSRFLHLFPKKTGFTVGDWLLRLRVWNARRLIEGSELPFSRIAELCGITDASRLGVLVRRYFGCTPGDLRRNLPESRSRTEEKSDGGGNGLSGDNGI